GWMLVVRLAGGALRGARARGDLHRHAVAGAQQLDLVFEALDRALTLDVGNVQKYRIHVRLLVERICSVYTPAGCGSSATSRIDTVSSSSWKCGRRNATAR